jgi:hypothetical protein
MLATTTAYKLCPHTTVFWQACEGDCIVNMNLLASYIKSFHEQEQPCGVLTYASCCLSPRESRQ